MAYSCLSIKNFYPDLELVTDDDGCRLLIDTLGLPYASVDLSLNKFDADPNLWALAKVFSYGIQTEPFIHVDNDIFIWTKFPERIENAGLCCQNFENLTSDYREGLSLVRDSHPSQTGLFHDLSLIHCDSAEYHSINAGILGGNDIDFINEYSHTVINGYKEYRNNLSSVGERVGLLNIVLEQLCFGVFAQRRQKHIEYLKDIRDFDELVNNIIDIYTAPVKTKFVHCLGGIKKDILISRQIECRLKYHYPHYHNRIMRYCNKINLGSEIDLDIDKDSYKSFEKAYAFISSFNDIKKFMATAQFKLTPGSNIHIKNGVIYLTTYSGQKVLSGWGKILTLLKEPKTGDEIVDILSVDLNNYFEKEEILDNVLSYLIHTLFQGGMIKPT